MKKEVKKPWGRETILNTNRKCTVKILEVFPGKRFSLQFHKHRDELWEFLDNKAKVIVGNKTFKANGGDGFFVKRGINHRIQALSKPVRVLEISFGEFDEEDIVRIEDDFNRK